jgi:MoaA/NifB/PqqE/SkfB family radical SAM enzyme
MRDLHVTTQALPEAAPTPRFLWLDLTRKCQLECAHCYNASGPHGTHGTMTRDDWIDVLTQAHQLGVRGVQLIGGEPTLHPHALDLTQHALWLGLTVEVFTNLVHITNAWWELLRHDGVTVATSYYAQQAAEHNEMTGRPSHQRTRANIEKAVRLGIPLRVGVIGDDTDRVHDAVHDLRCLGVAQVSSDRVRPFGRASGTQAPEVSGLCGRCGTGKAAIGPDGTVSPCVFSAWMGVGNVQEDALGAILGGSAMAQATTSIQRAARAGACEPDQECTPGYPGSGCTPRN